MLTFNCLVRKKVDVSADDFRNYWMNERFEMQRPTLKKLGVRKYTICETQHEDPVNKLMQQIYGTASDAYDFVNQLVINDLEDFKKGQENPEIQEISKALLEADAKYVDFATSNLWFSADLAQVFPREGIVATWDNTYLKVFYVPQRHPHLSLEQAQLHWNTCHGAMARQFATFLPFEKYIQGHRMESPVTNNLKEMRGVKMENKPLIIGQAEAWIDRRTVPALAGPEVDKMMGMLVEDISLFVNAGVSHIFATKEFVMHAEQVITSPLPTLFNVE